MTNKSSAQRFAVPIVKILAWAFGLCLIAVILAVALLRFAPEVALDALHRVQSDYRVEAPDLQLRLLPLTINASQMNVEGPGFTVQSTALDASLHWTRWATAEQLWEVTAERLDIVLHESPATETQTTAEPSANNAGLDAQTIQTIGRVLAGVIRLSIDEVTIGAQQKASIRVTNIAQTIEVEGKIGLENGEVTLLGSMSIQALSHPELSDAEDGMIPVPLDLVTSLQIDWRAMRSESKVEEGVEKGGEEGGEEGVEKRVGERVTADLDGVITLDEQVVSWQPQASRVVWHQARELQLEIADLAGQLIWRGNADQLELRDITALARIDEQASYDLSLAGTIDTLSAAPAWDASVNLGPLALQSRGDYGADDELQAWVKLMASSAPHFVSIAPFAGSEVFPLSLETQLTLKGDVLGLSNLQLDSPENVFVGEMTLALVGPLNLDLQVQAEQLYLPLIETTADQGQARSETDGSDPPSLKADATNEAPIEASALAASDEHVQDETEQKATVVDAKAPPKTPDERESDDDSEAQTPLFDDHPLSLTAFAQATAKIDLQAQNLRLQDAQFSDFSLALDLENGGTMNSKLRGTYGAGGFAGHGDFVVQEEGVLGVESAFQLSGMALEAFGILPSDQLSGGDVLLDFELAASGGSTLALAQSLSGDFLLVVRDAQLQNDLINLAGSDVLLEVLNKLNPFAKEAPATELQCVVVHFVGEEGVLRSKNEMFFETKKMEINGSGKISLPDEQLDITFSPHARQGVGLSVGSLVKFLKLGGTLRDPVPEVDALGLLQSTAAASAALSTGGLSIVAEGLAKRALAAGSPCTSDKFLRPAR